MKHYFSSDFHLGHNNVLKYDPRPQFKNIDHHDQAIIDNHNSIVNPEDNIYFLGDFAITDSRYVKSRLSQMNGIKFFIKGNHDKFSTVEAYKKFGTYLGEQYSKLVIDGQSIVLNHFPMRSWERSHRGAYHLYGHEHGALEATPWGRSMDVCIILNNYFPFEWTQIKAILDKRDILCHHSID